MDAYTLQVSTAMASAIMFLTLLSLYLSSNRNRCLVDWSLSGLFFFISNCIGLLSYYGPVPYILGPALANMLYLLAHLAIWVGIRRHLGLLPRWDVAILASLALFICHYVPGLLDTITNRLLIIYPLLMVINLSVLWVLIRAVSKAPDYHIAYFPLMFAEVIFFTQQFVRFLVVVFDQQLPLTKAGDEFLQTSGSLAVLAFLSLVNMACGLIVFRKQEIALRKASHTDQLTGWMNRGALDTVASEAFDAGKQGNSDFCIVMIDIDHFKKINDDFGHQFGDMALKHVTKLAQESMRTSDHLFRYGGEEFLLLFSGEDVVNLHLLSQRLKQRIENSPLEFKGHSIPLTVSIGIAKQERDDPHWEELLHRADLALYHSKRQGRNQVSFHDGDAPILLEARPSF
ncbi:GGDEF domain-containing protein [Shewanella sp. WXL01]|uniref:diguanylate cyclase n=1 Tax=Shewanella maritima TaxID=2520507 RepID=A0A411PJS4_9GAMM|nr:MULTISPECIES: GGDEF domain-containing protein [Shewanella]NKF50890.1 GGDEF domain-containing protein [Shewanella sp. WXL01]QBF83861.1 GGDEF domain-containing protein [Shewanella maritima]